MTGWSLWAFAFTVYLVGMAVGSWCETLTCKRKYNALLDRLEEMEQHRKQYAQQELAKIQGEHLDIYNCEVLVVNKEYPDCICGHPRSMHRFANNPVESCIGSCPLPCPCLQYTPKQVTIHG